MDDDAQKYINSRIKSGHDIVFAETHDVLNVTFARMAYAVMGNFSELSGVSLELSPALQPLIDKAGADEISEADFVRQAHTTMEEEYLDLAGKMLLDDQISEEDYSVYKEYISNNVSKYLNYTDEQLLESGSAYPSLYALSSVAGNFNVPVYATDVDRQILVLQDLERLGRYEVTDDDWLKRIDDNSDFELLTNQINLDTAQSILLHRGMAHTHATKDDISGLDDLLEASGRNVSVIGHYKNFQDLTEIANQRFSNSEAFKYHDPSDYTIVGNEGVNEPDLSLGKQGVSIGFDFPP